MKQQRKPYERIDPAIRFWAKVQKQDDGCWIWIGKTNARGYGLFGLNYKAVLAHRFSYELHKGEIPSGLYIVHICSVPSCVNPDHLEAMTWREKSRIPFIDALDRFWTYVEKQPNGCWLWTGSISDTGYGSFRAKGIRYSAHRFSYELHKGGIPEELHIDHICRVRACVNPDHLEAVTPKENSRRGNAPSMIVHRSGVCSKGHALTPENTAYISTRSNRKVCKTCRRIAANSYYKQNQRRIRERERIKRLKKQGKPVDPPLAA